METTRNVRVYVDLKASSNVVIPTSFIQYDTNIIDFIILENKEPADLSDVKRIIINFKRSDGEVLPPRLLVAEENIVTYQLGAREMEKPGKSQLELQFFGENFTRISTKRFSFVLDESLGTFAINEEEYTLAQELFVEIENVLSSNANVERVLQEAEIALESVEEATENANNAATAANQLVPRVNQITAQLEDNMKQINNINAPRITPIEIIAHRGFANLGPENTLTSFAVASDLGVTSLECDVQMSSDGVPVIIHDATVNRTTSGTGNVKDKSLAQLKALDAGTKFSPYFSGSKIPTFDEFLKFAKGRASKVYPEIKDIRTLADIETIVNVIRNNGMENVTVIQSFNLEHLLEVRKFSKVVKIALLIYDTALTQYAIDKLSEDGNSMVLYGYSYVISNPTIINTLYNLGIDLGVWVVPTRDVSDWLLQIGVTKQMFDSYIGGVV